MNARELELYTKLKAAASTWQRSYDKGLCMIRREVRCEKKATVNIAVIHS